MHFSESRTESLASLGSKDQSELPTMLLASPWASSISQGLGLLARALGDGLASVQRPENKRSEASSQAAASGAAELHAPDLCSSFPLGLQRLEI